MAKVLDHTGRTVHVHPDPDEAILWMWRKIAADIFNKVPVIGYTTDIVQAVYHVPVSKLSAEEITTLRQEGLL